MNRLHSLLLLIAVSLFSFISQAQNLTVKGRLIDGDSSFILPRGSVKIFPVTDSSKASILLADSTGAFQFNNLAAGEYRITFTYTGYDLSDRKISGGADSTIDLSDVLLFRKLKTLGNVTVIGRTPPARQKGDTTELNANAFKVNPDATTEDLLKKAPGITVENGVVTAQGEEVKKVTIDGRQFFGDDATAALKNLPAEVVDKIQVFDRMSDQAQLTGFDDGNAVKSINIVTKANMRNGQFGRIYAGYGTNERYAAGGSVNIFSGNRRINIVGLFNNVNQQNFSGEDLLGISGAANTGRGNQGNRGGGGGGGNFRGGGGNQNNFQVGPQPGIARTNAIGVNFSDLLLNRKLELTGSYFYNNSRTNTKSVTNRELFLPGDSSQFYNENRNSVADNNNHRVNMRLEYKIDSNNTLIIAPNFSYQDNKSVSFQSGQNRTENGVIVNSTSNSRRSNLDAYNFRNELTYRHGFEKRGRALTISFNSGTNRRNSDVILDAVTGFADTADILILDTVRQLTTNLSKGYNFSPGISWSEPVGKGQVQFNYNYQFNSSSADQENNFYDKVTGKYSEFDTTLSNLFENTVEANIAGVSYRLGNQANQFSAGVNYQGTTISSDQQFPTIASVNKNYSNFLPNLQYRRNFGKQANLRVMYRSSVNAPSVNQLQNVINNTNPLFITTGNPFLEQAYTHFLTARYNITNTIKGRSFFGGVFLQQVNDYVTNATYIATTDSAISKAVILKKGAQLSRPVNLDGYRSARGFLSYGISIKPLKSNLNLNGGINYVRTPGLINTVPNFSNNYQFNAGITIASNISEYVDFNVNYSANFNRVVNTIQPQLNNKYYYHNTGMRINLLTKSGWFLLNDVTNQLYTGLSDGFNQSFWLWNASAGKKFLKNKRGELKVSVFDLLNQNQSIARNVTDSYIEDVQTDVLQQYFMFTFTYTLRNFGQSATRNSSRMK